MSEEAAYIGIGVVMAVIYMTLGIGVARAAAKMNNSGIRIFHVFFWPVALGVIAASGGIE